MYTESMYYLQKNGAVNNGKDYTQGIGFRLCVRQPGYVAFLFMKIRKCFSGRWDTRSYLVAKHDNFVFGKRLSQCGYYRTSGIGSIRQNTIFGTGGQVDFVRGAQMSKGGESFIATHSVNVKKDGAEIRKIVMSHPEGGIITTGRTDVQYIVTEYGVADLQNKSRMQRAKALVPLHIRLQRRVDISSKRDICKHKTKKACNSGASFF